MTNTVLEIKALTKSFGDLIAVNDLSLSLKPGQIYGLLGPNGSGKSTLIKSILGIINSDSGETKLFGNLQAGSIKAKKRIGYMPQNPAVYQGLSVWENIYFFGKLYQLKDSTIHEKAKELLSILDLESKKNELAKNLSGGMVRRLSLATCLIHSPSLILLDEPTAGVDPILRLKFWNYFKKLTDYGAAIIITTHHISEASRCHTVGFLRSGQIFLEDTPSRIKEKYKVQDLEEAFVKATKETN